MNQCPICGSLLGQDGCPECLDRPARTSFLSPANLAILVFILSVLAAILVPNFMRARARGQITACKSNLKNIGTACEMFATDHKGLYPRKMAELMPAYLKKIPTCPGAGRDTYSGVYLQGEKNYTVFCSGLNHANASSSQNYPQFTSLEGLVER